MLVADFRSLAGAETPFRSVLETYHAGSAGIGAWAWDVHLARAFDFVTLGLTNRENTSGLGKSIKLRVVDVWCRKILHSLCLIAIKQFNTKVVSRALTNSSWRFVSSWSRCDESLAKGRTFTVTEASSWSLL
jgi:hypothetical protein